MESSLRTKARIRPSTKAKSKIPALLAFAQISTIVTVALLPGCSKKSAPPSTPQATPQEISNLAPSDSSTSSTTVDVSVASEAVSEGSPKIKPGAVQGVDPVPVAPVQDAIETAKKPEEPMHSCISLSFKHENVSGHKSDEDCSNHKNVLRLKHAFKEINSKSLCIRVNGTPVRHQIVKDTVVIGPMAGPKATITARYCLGKAKCAEDCTPPKDEFLEALGVADEDFNEVPNRKLAKWNPDDTENKDEQGDVTAQLDAEVLREIADISDLSSFDGWKSEKESAACTKLSAKL